MNNQWSTNEICEKSCAIEICSKLPVRDYRKKGGGLNFVTYCLFIKV